MPKERMTAAEIGVHFTNAFLILIVVLFVLFSLWVEVFAIPVFFVFFRAAVVTVGSARQVSRCASSWLRTCIDWMTAGRKLLSLLS